MTSDDIFMITQNADTGIFWMRHCMNWKPCRIYRQCLDQGYDVTMEEIIEQCEAIDSLDQILV